MAIYKQERQGNIILNGASIPCDPKNKDYARILREVAAGAAEIVKA